jgi:hypothetical protein
MYTRGFGQVEYGPTLEQLSATPLTLPSSNVGGGGVSPADIAMGLNPLPANNPLSASGQSNLSAAQLQTLSNLNAQYFPSTSSLTDWFNSYSSYIIIGGAAILALLFFGPSRRRR